MRNNKSGITRRGLLQTGMAAATVAAGGLAMNLLSPFSAEAASKTLPAKWDKTFDVIVIGSGFAGLAAAAEAAESGLSVVIVEKMPLYGGNSIINGGEYNSWTDKLKLRQSLNLGDDSAELHKSDTLKGGDFYGDPELIELLTDNSSDALNWMVDEGGLKLRHILNRTGGHSAYRTHTCVEGVGRGYTEALKRIAEKRGVKFMLNTPVSWLWRASEEKPVIGVETDVRGRKRNLKANKAVIMASGGFSQDKVMRMEFNPSIVPEYNCTNQPGATGEMLRYAQAIGAETMHLAFIQLYPYAEPETGILDSPAVYPFRGPGYGMIAVDKNGNRFVNDLERRDVVSRAEINTGMKPTYSIFNEAMIPLMGTKDEVEAGLKKGRFVKADSVEELAQKLGMKPDVLAGTVKKHNKYLRQGNDPDFGKPITDKMIPIEKGPFYGIAQWPAVHHTMGGVRINKQTQVIDIWGNVIPNLYACGESTGGIHGINRLGGNAIPDAVVFGRIAGRNAAK
ncbi:flavocytochrome c [Denitrovibrio acetiphilus DSM 12809]|uniref:Flavocytochrome c n=1 Tax=Denitrovibrio acetiphilus (strain DSM 12809 / NBRC 114555 / N2460) TaxID=522772 RepID=D4H4F4_DENA2|nr:flavocytochrome c [Denitrovibrio acetiphilus]ADD69283.1 flavocytochrome c [Denitrovibrio acetiphilus DSM 12809]